MTERAELRVQLDEILLARERENMARTIEKFLEVFKEHPNDAHVLYELGGAYDTAGNEAVALEYYERAIKAGLDGVWLRQCYLQLGSTLRNLEKFDDSLTVFDLGLQKFPDSTSLKIFRALTLHAMGKVNASLGTVFELLTSDLKQDEIARYEASIRGNAEYLIGLDQ